jgi:hypothetical protein
MGTRPSGYLFFGFEVEDHIKVHPTQSHECTTLHFEERDEFEYFLTALCAESGASAQQVGVKELLAKEDDARNRLKKFCQEQKIEYKEPYWYLAAQYD